MSFYSLIEYGFIIADPKSEELMDLFTLYNL